MIIKSSKFEDKVKNDDIIVKDHARAFAKKPA